MKRPAPIVRHICGEYCQSAVDRLSDKLHTRNPATSLSFDPKQKCLHLTGFPDMDNSECVQILSEVSGAWNLLFQEKTAQGVIIIKLTEPSQGQGEFQSAFANQRSRDALRAKWRRIRPHRKSALKDRNQIPSGPYRNWSRSRATNSCVNFMLRPSIIPV